MDSSTAELIDATSGNLPKTEAVNVLFATSLTAGAPPSDKRGKENQGKPLQTVEAGGFVFQLMDCKLANKSITCSFVVTNPNKDEILTMFGSSYSKFFDYEGNEYGAVKAQISNSQRDNNYVQKRLISGIPTKASIGFSGVPSKLQGIALLEIHCGTSNPHIMTFQVQFRNIPLSK